MYLKLSHVVRLFSKYTNVKQLITSMFKYEVRASGAIVSILIELDV